MKVYKKENKHEKSFKYKYKVESNVVSFLTCYQADQAGITLNRADIFKKY